MSASSRAVAVFDSGVGGLTVLRALRAALPAEKLIYFGDTARLPYGSKSKEAVTRFSLQIGRFLCRRRVKMLVVACNSASALALRALEEALPVPVVGVIEPAARAAAKASGGGAIGVIGTEATVASRAYERAINRLAPRVRVESRACPLFVPLVEEGWWSHPVTAAVAAEYLAPLKRRKVSALILGCTHYPLIKRTLREAAGPRTRLIDSGEEAARETAARLAAAGLLRLSGKGSEEFFVSDGPERFRRLARRFLGRPVGKVRVERFE